MQACDRTGGRPGGAGLRVTISWSCVGVLTHCEKV